MEARTLHGVNLAGWLTLESWATPQLFANSGALDEPSLMTSLGVARYRKLVKDHRASFVDASDFVHIAARGFNAVRLPIPWYAFDASAANDRFVTCVDYVDRAFEWAEEIGLNLVLALAASPGRHGAEAPLVRNGVSLQGYRNALLGTVASLASRYAHRVGLYGIEVLDAPVVRRRRGLGVTHGVSLHALRAHYQDAYRAIRVAAGDDVVVILPDGGVPGAWRSFASQGRYRNVWLSCQLFHHTDHVDASGPLGVRRLVDRSRARLREAGRGELPVAVSGWSGALPYADALTTPEGRIALERVYVSEQLAAFRSCPAWFFQTWKTNGRLAGWDARVSLATLERRMLA